MIGNPALVMLTPRSSDNSLSTGRRSTEQPVTMLPSIDAVGAKRFTTRLRISSGNFDATASIVPVGYATFSILPDCRSRIPCYTAAHAYLRSFAGVSFRRLICLTKMRLPRDSSMALRT